MPKNFASNPDIFLPKFALDETYFFVPFLITIAGTSSLIRKRAIYFISSLLCIFFSFSSGKLATTYFLLGKINFHLNFHWSFTSEIFMMFVCCWFWCKFSSGNLPIRFESCRLREKISLDNLFFLICNTHFPLERENCCRK